MVMVLLLVVDHVWRGEMAERRRVLMEAGRHHGYDWWKTDDRCRLHHKSFSNDGFKMSTRGNEAATSTKRLDRRCQIWWQSAARSGLVHG